MLVNLKGSANKTFKKLPQNTRLKITTIIDNIALLNTLEEIPNDGKLKGYPDRYKIRLGNYRIIYKIESANEILITAIAHRKDIYNKLFNITL